MYREALADNQTCINYLFSTEQPYRILTLFILGFGFHPSLLCSGLEGFTESLQQKKLIKAAMEASNQRATSYSLW